MQIQEKNWKLDFRPTWSKEQKTYHIQRVSPSSLWSAASGAGAGGGGRGKERGIAGTVTGGMKLCNATGFSTSTMPLKLLKMEADAGVNIDGAGGGGGDWGGVGGGGAP